MIVIYTRNYKFLLHFPLLWKEVKWKCGKELITKIINTTYGPFYCYVNREIQFSIPDIIFIGRHSSDDKKKYFFFFSF